MMKVVGFKIRKLNEHILKLESKIARLKAERERLLAVKKEREATHDQEVS